MAWGLIPSEEDYSLGQAEPLFQPGGLGYAPLSPQEQANFQSWKAQNFPEEEKPKKTNIQAWVQQSFRKEQAEAAAMPRGQRPTFYNPQTDKFEEVDPAWAEKIGIPIGHPRGTQEHAPEGGVIFSPEPWKDFGAQATPQPATLQHFASNEPGVPAGYKQEEEPAPQRGTEPDVPRGTNVPQPPAPVPQTSPITVYSRGTKAGGPDPSNDPYTNTGYTATGRNLTEGMVAVDPKVYPLGSILRDEQSGRLFLAGDKHGADDPTTVDVYVDPASYTQATQESGQKRQFSVVGRVNPDDMPTTPEGVRGLLDQVGQKSQGGQQAAQTDMPDSVDSASAQQIATLEPQVQGRAANFAVLARNWGKENGYEVVITEGYRTPERQNELYAQGRTAPGPKVTNARGGQSNHQSKKAFDFTILKNGKEVTDERAWRQVAAIGKDLGFEWGGDWKSFKDPNHLQYMGADVRGEPDQARLYPEPSKAKRLYPEPRRAEMPARPDAGGPQPMGPGIYNYPRADAATPEEIRMARAPSEEQLLAAPPEQRFGGETFGINPYRARMAEMALPVYGWSPSPTPVEGEGVPQRMAPPGPEPQAVTAERPFEFGIAPPQEAPPYRYGTGTLPSDYGLAAPAQAEPAPAAAPVAPGTTPAPPAPKTAAQTAAEAGPAKLEAGTQNDLVDMANTFVRSGSSTGFLGTLEGISAAVANSLPDLGPITDYIRGNARHNVEEIAKMRKRIESGLPVDRDFEKSTLGGAIGMVGQMTPQVLAAVGTGGISPVLAGTLSAVQSLAGLYDEERQDALAHGASEKEANDAAVKYTMYAGSLDVAGDLFIVGRLFKGAKAAKWTVGRTLTEAGKAGTFESLTEGGQQAIQNWIAKGYDPDRQVTDDVIDTIKATFLGGGFLGGAGYTAGSLLERKERAASRAELEASAETLKGVAVEPPKGELTPEEQAAFRAEEPPAAAPTAPSEAAPEAPAAPKSLVGQTIESIAPRTNTLDRKAYVAKRKAEGVTAEEAAAELKAEEDRVQSQIKAALPSGSQVRDSNGHVHEYDAADGLWHAASEGALGVWQQPPQGGVVVRVGRKAPAAAETAGAVKPGEFGKKGYTATGEAKAPAAPEEAARYSKIPPQTAPPAERIYASDIVPKLIEEKKLPPDYMDYAFWERLQGEGETPEAITESFFKKNEIELARISKLTGWTPTWNIKPGETITKTASRDPNTSKLYTAPLHILAEDIAAAEGLDPMKFERGFLTSEGRFVGRQEGLAIAKKAQQKNVNVEKAQAGELFGENIRPAPEAAAPAAAKPTVSVQAFDRESGAFVETELNPSPELHNQLKREENFYATLIKCLEGT